MLFLTVELVSLKNHVSLWYTSMSGNFGNMLIVAGPLLSGQSWNEFPILSTALHYDSFGATDRSNHPPRPTPASKWLHVARTAKRLKVSLDEKLSLEICQKLKLAWDSCF